MDNRNHTLYRSIAFLSHPLSIFAIFLLLFNDHVLRVVFSSWVFGKLGDLAWLFLFPPLLILLLSLLFRPKSISQGEALSKLAYGLTGFVFILANLSSDFNSLVLVVMDLLLGKPHRLVSDPTDLIALCALLGS